MSRLMQIAEKLDPSGLLEFYPSQLELVRKYKKTLEKNNHVNLRIFFLILSCEYLLKIILLLVFEGRLPVQAHKLGNPAADPVHKFVGADLI